MKQQKLNIAYSETFQTSVDDLLAEFSAYCQKRKYHLEGVPMYLVLEDVSKCGPMKTNHTSDPLFDLFIASSLQVLTDAIARQKGEVTSEDLGVALELLAERYFRAMRFSSELTR